MNEIVEYIATKSSEDANEQTVSNFHSIINPLSTIKDLEDMYGMYNLQSLYRVTQREQTHDRDSIREMASSNAKRVKRDHPFLYE